MIRFCMICKKVFGEKKPFEDKSETTGICDLCWPVEMARIEAILEEQIKKQDLPTPGPQSQGSSKET